MKIKEVQRTEIYYISESGRGFRSEADCLRYEEDYKKWSHTDRFLEIQDADGCNITCYYIDHDLEELLWYLQQSHTYCAVSQACRTMTTGWVYIKHEYEPSMNPLTEFKDILEETIVQCQETLQHITGLMNRIS